MFKVFVSLALLSYASSAKLDHLKYLPPNSKPVDQEKYDQGLSVPKTKDSGSSPGYSSQYENNFSGQQPQTYGGLRNPKTSFQPKESGSSTLQIQGSYQQPTGNEKSFFRPSGTAGESSGFPQSSTFVKNVPSLTGPSTGYNQPTQTSGGCGSSQGTPCGAASFGSSAPSAPQNFAAQTYQTPSQSPKGCGSQGSSSAGCGSSNSYVSSGQQPSYTQPSKPFNLQPSYATQNFYNNQDQNQIPIIRLETENAGDGTYKTAYETGNGIQAEEEGQTQGDNTVAQGGYSYTSPEGQKIGVSYTADENGYHPTGDHLPTPPPIPDAILKSIMYNEAHPEEESNEGEYTEKTQFSSSKNKYLTPKSYSSPNNQISNSFPSQVTGSSGFKSQPVYTSSSFNSAGASDKPSNQQPNSFSSEYSSSPTAQSQVPSSFSSFSNSAAYPKNLPSSQVASQTSSTFNANFKGPVSTSTYSASSLGPAGNTQVSSFSGYGPLRTGKTEKPASSINHAGPTTNRQEHPNYESSSDEGKIEKSTSSSPLSPYGVQGTGPQNLKPFSSQSSYQSGFKPSFPSVLTHGTESKYSSKPSFQPSISISGGCEGSQDGSCNTPESSKPINTPQTGYSSQSSYQASVSGGCGGSQDGSCNTPKTSKPVNTPQTSYSSQSSYQASVSGGCGGSQDGSCNTPEAYKQINTPQTSYSGQSNYQGSINLPETSKLPTSSQKTYFSEQGFQGSQNIPASSRPSITPQTSYSGQSSFRDSKGEPLNKPSYGIDINRSHNISPNQNTPTNSLTNQPGSPSFPVSSSQSSEKPSKFSPVSNLGPQGKSFNFQSSQQSSSSGYQYNAPSVPFNSNTINAGFGSTGFNRPSNSFQSSAPTKPSGSFRPSISQSSGSSQTSSSYSGTNPQFSTSGTYSQGNQGQFGISGQSGPVRTPGVQPIDQNGGYIY